MSFCCFTSGIFLNRNVLATLCFIVLIVFSLPYKKAPLGLRSVLLKEGEVQEAGVSPLQLWKQNIFVANNERLYISGPSAAFILSHSYLETRGIVWRVRYYWYRVENTSPKKLPSVKPKDFIQLQFKLAVSNFWCNYIKASYF